ncbi:hypothetical protein DdX_18791 [Ditylenchus destructor]|uniref:Uncharacterized protein n=1 Tax=Ditylenchus destructor TaxID=166010 RepID=A0AAD4MKX0_9BILA|nr:hypothetical protein DdX_18791 [Ditylenchus destructor]
MKPAPTGLRDLSRESIIDVKKEAELAEIMKSSMKDNPEQKYNSVVQFASVKSSGPEKFTFMKTSKIHLADPVVSSQNFIKTLQDAAESADDTVMSIVDLRLKVLSDPAITPTGFVTIASDGANKAQIFTGFKLKAGIDYEFSIHMAKIVFQDEVLSLTIPHEKNVVIHEDEKIDANLNPEELEYPSI